MKISVCCPTRGRKDMLVKGIDSLINSAHNISNIEILFRFDEDDTKTIEDVKKYYDVKETSVQHVKHKFPWGTSTYRVHHTVSKSSNDKEWQFPGEVSMKFLIGYRHTYFYINRYNDECCHVATGEYLMHWTDDLSMVENPDCLGWDTIIKEGEGQHYMFFFRDRHLGGNPQWPVCTPKKFFDINGRLCPNLLDDQWWNELCKVLPAGTKVVIDYAANHDCLFQTKNADITVEEGRASFDKTRERELDYYEYYDLSEMEKIKDFLLENPNTKETSQFHDHEIAGKPFQTRGASGRWHKDFKQ